MSFLNGIFGDFGVRHSLSDIRMYDFSKQYPLRILFREVFLCPNPTKRQLHPKPFRVHHIDFFRVISASNFESLNNYNEQFKQTRQ